MKRKYMRRAKSGQALLTLKTFKGSEFGILNLRTKISGEKLGFLLRTVLPHFQIGQIPDNSSAAPPEDSPRRAVPNKHLKRRWGKGKKFYTPRKGRLEPAQFDEIKKNAAGR